MSEIRISPSPLPIVALSLKARLIPELGSPILSRMESSSWAGITRRISASTAAKMRSASSMRVPVGQRTCSRICPAST